MLRPAEEKDISRIAEILIFTKRDTYRSIFNNDDVSFNKMQVLNEIRRLNNSDSLNNLYVYDDGIVKAIITLENKDPWLNIKEFFVDPFFQHNGIGTKILKEVFLRNDKFLLYVLDKNKRAIDFYEKMGFKYSGEKEEFENSGFYMLKFTKV